MKKFLIIILGLVTIMATGGCSSQKENLESGKTDYEEEVVIPQNIENGEVVEDNSTATFLENYKTPDSLSANFMDYTFRLENKLYSLPVPVSEFLDDGWEITAAPDSLRANSIHSNGIAMKKDGKELNFKIANFSDTEIKPEESIVIAVRIIGVFSNGDDSILKNLDFESSGGIRLGMSISDLENSIDTSEFTIEHSDVINGDTQYSYFEPSNSIYLTFGDDKLKSLSIEKNKFD